MPAGEVKTRDGLTTAVRAGVVVLALAVVVLAATGVWLWFNYRPSARQAWPTAPGWASTESWVRTMHRIASSAALLVALAVVVLLVVRRVRTAAPGIVAGLGMVATAFAAGFTGYLLPWDQLALWAVTVGSDMTGMRAVFDARVKYVLIGSHEVAPGAYRFWAISHVALGALVAVAISLAWTRSRSRAATAEATSVAAAAGQV